MHYFDRHLRLLKMHDMYENVLLYINDAATTRSTTLFFRKNCHKQILAEMTVNEMIVTNPKPE
jgi:hypothetical protein